MNRRKPAKLAAFALAAACLWGCGSDPVAGTDAGNAGKVAGTLADTSGAALAGRVVWLRNADFQGPRPDSLPGHPEVGLELSDTTGPDGGFAFSLAQADTGRYVVESMINESKGVRASFHRGPGESVRIGSLVMRPVGAVQGALRLPPAAFAGGVVSVLGTPLSEVLPTGGGGFTFYNLAAGEYRLRVEGFRPLRGPADTVISVTVQSGVASQAPEIRFKLKALIVDGISNHDWRRMTRYDSSILAATGLFDVAISTLPPDRSGPEKWNDWNPRFSEYDVAILICNSGYGQDAGANPWPDSIKARLDSFVAVGGGLVYTHATFPGYAGWPAFADMHGLNWGTSPAAGASYRVDSAGALLIDSASIDSASFEADEPAAGGELIGVAHPEHPINLGLPAQWLLPPTPLAYRLKGGPEGITVLAYSTNTATGKREPQLWVKSYGKGRVFTDEIGHLTSSQPNTVYRCAGYQTTFARGVEWAASGQVTLPVPQDFPGRDSISLRSVPPD